MFVSHAQLYVFADTYEASNLQKLTAHRLEDALAKFEFASPCPTDFAALLDFVHDNTAGKENEADILRTIVGNFVANNIEFLIESSSFRALVGSNGMLGLDFFSKIVNRLKE